MKLSKIFLNSAEIKQEISKFSDSLISDFARNAKLRK